MTKMSDRVWTWRIGALLLLVSISVVCTVWWEQVWAYKAWLATGVSWLVTGIQWYQGRSVRFYTFLAKGKALLTSSKVGYSLSADYDGTNITPDRFAAVCRLMYGFGERRETLSDKQDYLVLKVDGMDYVLKFRWTELDDQEAGHINLQLLEYHGPYDPTARDLQDKVLPLLRTVEEALCPEQRSYALSLYFRGENPFLGVYSKRIPKADLRNFQCEILEPEALKGAPTRKRVRVSRAQMDFVATDVHGLTSLLSKHLALSGG